MLGVRQRRVAALVASLALAAAGFAAVAALPAGAATTTIGDVGGSTTCAANADGVQSAVGSGNSYTVPAGIWNVTSWSTQAGGGDVPYGSMQLEIWRPTATVDQYMLVGISPVGATTTSGTNTFPLAAPIAVEGGDLLGLRNLTDGFYCVRGQAGGVAPGAVNPTAPVPGDVRTLPAVPGYALNISATLEATPPVLQVEKVVSGPSSSGFAEQVQCTLPQSTVVDVSLPFNADGTPDAASPPAGWTVSDGSWQLADAALTRATCTVTETDTGGAASVSYACSWTPGLSDNIGGVGCPGASSGPSATPASVTFEGNGDVGVLTVTNTFTAPPITPIAPPPVQIAPKFTG